jgi:hypothetical protein
VRTCAADQLLSQHIGTVWGREHPLLMQMRSRDCVSGRQRTSSGGLLPPTCGWRRSLDSDALSLLQGTSCKLHTDCWHGDLDSLNHLPPSPGRR